MDEQLSSEFFIFLGRMNDCYFRAHWELENHFRYFWWVHRAIGSEPLKKQSWKQKVIGAVILVEWLWVFVAFSEDQSSVPSTYVRRLTTAYKASLKDLKLSSNSEDNVLMCIFPHTNKTYTYMLNNKLKENDQLYSM